MKSGERWQKRKAQQMLLLLSSFPTVLQPNRSRWSKCHQMTREKQEKGKAEAG